MADSNGQFNIGRLSFFDLCLTCKEHIEDVRHFWILIISRLCSGIATSLLFSAFESWIIKAHAVEHLDKVRKIIESVITYFDNTFLRAYLIFEHKSLPSHSYAKLFQSHLMEIPS